MPQSTEILVADRLLSIETNRLAMQADSAVTVRYGDTVILVTACIDDAPHEGADFIHLTVDYEERHYAVGKIPGSFIRRESRPSEYATLTARLTDRSLRPLLSKSLHNDIQIVATVLSSDQENASDVLAVIGASTALTLSSIPFSGPVAAVRIGYLDGRLVLNPTLPQMNDSLIDLIVASTKDAVVMVEGEAQEAPDDLILEAIELGHGANQEIIKLQENLQQKYGKSKVEIKVAEANTELVNAITSKLGDRLAQAVSQKSREEREKIIASVKKEIFAELKDTFSDSDIASTFDAQLKLAARDSILNRKQHLDGRQVNEVRTISGEVGLLPRTHGSGLFTRGQTQVLAITTLGSSNQEQIIDGLGLEGTKRFMHHYNFAPFSNGEVKRLGSPGRREIGHGALAEKAIAQVLPKEADFSYTIRIVSEVLSSNGSTSMASVCSASLSLMDAGVPIKSPVVGVAMGLVTGKDGNYVILTDIEGMEDAYGDMDFKVAGTSQGITAIQLDIKLKGISQQILTGAVKQAREAHSVILDKVQQIIGSSRAELSRYAPRMYKIAIDPSKIGTVIGPGGRTIRSITEQAKVAIDVQNDGTVTIGANNEEAAQKAIEMVEKLTKEAEVGGIYTGKVTRLSTFGAFVEILPGKDGLVHISEFADYHVAKVEDVAKIGDEITVKVIGIDNMGRINLSRRAVFEGSSRVPGARDRDSTPANRDPKHQGPRPAPRAHNER